MEIHEKRKIGIRFKPLRVEANDSKRGGGGRFTGAVAGKSRGMYNVVLSLPLKMSIAPRKRRGVGQDRTLNAEQAY